MRSSFFSLGVAVHLHAPTMSFVSASVKKGSDER